MLSPYRASPRVLSRSALLLLLLLTLAASGCASFYVDGNLKEVSTAAFAKPAVPKPAQVLFEFQTKGTANARVTDALKARVLEQVRESGLFSEVGEGPAAGGALLSIVVNNIPLTDDAARKGFVTGLTFGLAGSQVTDGYICTASYTPSADGLRVTKEIRHAIHAALGNAAPPPGALPAANVEDAVTRMLRTAISHLLKEVSTDGARAP